MSEHRDIMNPYNTTTTATTTTSAPALVPATAGSVISISHLSHPHTTHTTQPPATHLSAATAPATGAAATATAPAPSTTVNDSSSQSEEMQCQWQGCSDRCSSPEALYDHICERHVGRKSTNNLNLTCHWGHCRTTTVKRDHITSHIRVHVPLKPHKCDFCGKSFKRPQDLKKHVKTHADDSVLVRSPEPHSRNPDLTYQTNGRGYGAPAHYYEQPSGNPVVSQGYTNGATHYYQPHPSHPSHLSSHNNSTAYGSVYYTLNPGGADGDSYGNRKRAFDALNEFFGDVKRRQFDPASYAAVGQRMHGLHSLNLPLLSGPLAVPEYQQSVPAAVPSIGPGGYGSGAATQAAVAAPSYQLPPMSNVRTKSDLINIDQFLEQMQNTIYESEEHVAAAGLGQPGSHYVSGAMSHHGSSHSPPTHQASTASHPYGAAGTIPSYSSASSGPTIGSMTSAAHSPGSSGTPALTPPSSAQSYTSGHSPVSSTSTSHNRAMPLHDSGANLYPRLPSHRDGMTTAAGYHPPTSAAAGPPSTLGGHYDHDERRRYMGGILQRARPNDRDSVDAMDTSRDGDGNNGATDGDRTPRAKEGSVERNSPKRVSPGVIDPALHPDASPKPSDAAAAAAAAAELAQGTFSHLADTMRIIDRLRELVAGWLREGTLDGEQSSARPKADDGQEDDPMDGVESHQSQGSPDGEEEKKRQHPKEDVTKADAADGTRLYPTLRAIVDDEDGEARSA